jgi:tripartite ATP-independent transporter DctM subunit
MEFIQLLVLLVPMFLLMALGVPIFLSMGITCLAFILAFDLPITILAQSYVRGLANYDFLALPFFFLAGDLMNTGGITVRLLNFSKALVGHIRGGLSHVTIVTSMIFAGVSGSAVADAAAVGSVLIPAMKRGGYPGSYAAAVAAAAGTIGPIIPPSIPLVIYGLYSQISIGKLFLGGATPGILMGVYLIIASIIISRRRGYPADQRATLMHVLRSSLDAILALMMPVIILGGIITGIVTATESAVLAVSYGLILGCFVYRDTKARDLPLILGKAMINSGTVLIIIATTGVFCWIIANMGLGDALVRGLLSISGNKWVLLGVINIFFLIWGCFLDPVTALLIVIPILIPLAQKVGIDLIHFGVVAVLNLMIGLVTPPVGVIVYLTSSMAQEKVEVVFKESVPFLIALLLVLIMSTYLPGIVTWLPNLIMK